MVTSIPAIAPLLASIPASPLPDATTAPGERAGVRIAIAQLNPMVGDLPGNAARIVDAARQAHAAGARLLVTPELALTGYPPEDLLMRSAFNAACDAQLASLAEALQPFDGLKVVVGHPRVPDHGGARGQSVSVHLRFNAASVLAGGRVEATYCKRELPNYQVFDERHYFVSGRDADLEPVVVEAGGVRFGILICEDAWFDEPAGAAMAAGAEALVVLNASPFHVGKIHDRERRMAECVRAHRVPLAYVHLVGGQDEVVYDGASFVCDASGAVAARAPFFREDLLVVDLLARGHVRGPLAPVPEPEAQAWHALVLGLHDYVFRNGFPGAVLGLSGGVDSALVLALAVDALGADRVRTVMMPSAYTADISQTDAAQMAVALGVRHDVLAVEPMFADFRATLAPLFAGRADDTTEENLQARIRGVLLMAVSNKFGDIVLTTGNKSELATGYCTLYGDMAGGFAPIKDVAKTLVYTLCRWKNAQPRTGADGADGPVIPQRILTRPPSAELRPDQTDQDSLPPYEVVDAIVARYVENDEPIAAIVAAGHDPADVERITRLIKVNEYKRRQAAVGTRITPRAFGRDWRQPLTSAFRA